MLRQNQKLFDQIHFFCNAVGILAAWLFFYLIVQTWDARLLSFANYTSVFFTFLVVILSFLAGRQFRADSHLTSVGKILWEMFLSCALGLMAMVFFLFAFKKSNLSRLYLIGSAGVSFFVLSLWNLAIFGFLKLIRQKGLNYQNLLLVGNRYSLPAPIEILQKNHSLGQRILAIVSIDEEMLEDRFMGHKVFHGSRSLKKLLDEHVVDNVLFTVYRQNPIAIEEAMLLCQERGIKVWLKPDFMHQALVSRVDYLDRMPLFVFSMGPENLLGMAIKRIFDVVASLLLLAVLAIPMGMIALMVKRDPGPVLFRQKRVGLNGRHFMIYKFRTMYKDADLRRAEYNLKNEMKGPVFKMKNDPRITPLGKFLRKYSLDELPQIWNVLWGNMSLVGPRPPLPTEVELYKGWQRRRLSMRPGITCIWQVTGRNKITDFNEWAKLDLKYIDEWSLWLDFKILLETIPAVFKGTGI